MEMIFVHLAIQDTSHTEIPANIYDGIPENLNSQIRNKYFC